MPSPLTVKVIEFDSHTLLEHLQKKGIVHPKQCCGGYCGTCRIEVSNPDSFVEVQDLQGNAIEQIGFRNDNEVLACAVRPTEDVEVLIPKP